MSVAAHALVQRLTAARPAAARATAAALQQLWVDRVRACLHAGETDAAVALLHCLDVAPEMTDVPLHELLTALLHLAGAVPADHVRRPRPAPHYVCAHSLTHTHTHIQVGPNQFLREVAPEARPQLERVRLYEALVRPDSAFMLSLLASIETDALVRVCTTFGSSVGAAARLIWVHRRYSWRRQGCPRRTRLWPRTMRSSGRPWPRRCTPKTPL
jgi:hypothetical protein